MFKRASFFVATLATVTVYAVTKVKPLYIGSTGLPTQASSTSDYLTAKGFSFNNSDATLIDESSGTMRFYTGSTLGGTIDATQNFNWNYSMGIGSVFTPTATLQVQPSAVSSGALPYPDFQILSPSHTNLPYSQERIAVDFDGSATQTWTANAYTFPVQRYMTVRQPKIAFTASDNIESYAGTVQIAGPPIAGTNALINNSVTLQLTGGAVNGGGSVNNTYALVAVAPVGGSSNYSASFLNGNVGINTLTPTARLQILPGTATAGTAPLKILEGVLMTAPEAGAIENEGFKLMYSTSSPITRHWVSTVVDRATSNVTVSNTVTETTVYSYTVGAGSLGTNKTLRLSMRGTFFNQTGSNRFIKVQVKFGTQIIYTATHNMATAATPRAFYLTVEFGNDGATNANNGYATSRVGMAGTNTGTGDVVYDELFARGSANVDTTADRSFVVTFTNEIASANLYGIMDNALLEFL